VLREEDLGRIFASTADVVVRSTVEHSPKTGIIQTALPLSERTGVAADTFQQRLSDEVAGAAAVFAHPTLLSAWATIDQAA
jgi:hypothetical protein